MAGRRKWDGNEMALFRRHARPGEIKKVDDLGKEIMAHKKIAFALQEQRRILIRRVYSRGRMREERQKKHETDAIN